MVGSSILGTVAGYVIGSALVSSFMGPSMYDQGYDDGSADAGGDAGADGSGDAGADAGGADAAGADAAGADMPAGGTAAASTAEGSTPAAWISAGSTGSDGSPAIASPYGGGFDAVVERGRQRPHAGAFERPEPAAAGRRGARRGAARAHHRAPDRHRRAAGRSRAGLRHHGRRPGRAVEPPAAAVERPAADRRHRGDHVAARREPHAGFSLLWVFPATWLASSFALPGLIVGSVSVSVHLLAAGRRPTPRRRSVPPPSSSRSRSSPCRRRRISRPAGPTAQRSLLDKQARLLARTVERVQRQEDTVTEVLDAVDFGVIRIAADGSLAVTNEAHARLQQAAVPGGTRAPSPRAVYSSDGITPLEPADEPLARARRGEAFESELSGTAHPANGGGRSASLEAAARRRRRGRGGIVVSRDVTAEVTALRARDDLVASVSHELRTPLTSILGYIELVLDDEHLSASARRQLRHRRAQRDAPARHRRRHPRRLRRTRGRPWSCRCTRARSRSTASCGPPSRRPLRAPPSGASPSTRPGWSRPSPTSILTACGR